MLKWTSKAVPATESNEPARVAHGGEAAVTALKALSRSVSDVGRDAAAVRGALDDTQRVMKAQGQAMQTLGGQLQDISRSQQAISQASQHSADAVARAQEALQAVGAEVQGIAQSLAKVSEAAADITKISLQTRLVAFNASVEAKHAGDAGRGFGVVADAVKALAAQVEASSKTIVSAIGGLQARIDDFGAQLVESDRRSGHNSEIHAAFQAVQVDVRRIAESASQGAAQMVSLNEQAQRLEREVNQASQGLQVALDGSDRFLRLSEDLIERIAGSGVEVEDGAFIRLAQAAAGEIGELLASALRSGTISEADLFDENYRPISGTNPPQHLTAFCALTDRLFPEVQERIAQADAKIAFAIAADRNGYIATHNQRYCHPQRAGDLAWNTANSRYRRIFNDRTGLASARNTKPFLLQTYRRDMGGGNFVILKEAAAPIVVNGRHWGGFRLGFNF